MIVDGNLIFDNPGVAITNATVQSNNVIDLGVARDIGAGDDPSLKLAVIVGAAFTTSNSATLNIQLQASPDDSNWTTIIETGPLTAAQLLANIKVFKTDVPLTGIANRYLRLQYVVAASTAFTAGNIGFAGIVLNRSDILNYPSGINAYN